jgi:hypothetical protein
VIVLGLLGELKAGPPANRTKDAAMEMAMDIFIVNSPISSHSHRPLSMVAPGKKGFQALLSVTRRVEKPAHEIDESR